MAIKYFGWGRWGNATLDQQLALGESQGIAWEHERLVEEDCGYGHFPDALSAEAGFMQKEAQWRKLLGGSEGFCRLHYLNVSENFSSGALSGFLKSQPAFKQTMDIIVAFMPPPGANPASAGRLFANIYGRKKFADLIILVDACAPLFADSEESEVSAYAATLGVILYAFERSGCMLPLLLRMRAKTLLPAFADARQLRADCSLEKLWQALLLSGSGLGRAPAGSKDLLAFSVSDRRGENLANLYERNWPRDKLVYLPFFRQYEWSSLAMPVPGVSGAIHNFTGIFWPGIAPARIGYFLDNYVESYWARDGREDFETPELAVQDWLGRKRLRPGERISQKIDLVERAWDYIGN